MATRAPDTVDLEVAGLARVRLVNPAPADVAALEWRLGGVRVPVEADPDLLIELVKRSFSSGHLIGTDGAGFTEEAYIAKGAGGGPQSTIDFDASPLHVTSARGSAAVPYLAALLNLAVLGRDILPLHASTFEVDGSGIAVCGWAGAGKSEALLAFVRKGARGVADEWTYVNPAGGLHGVGTPVRLESWHLRQLPGHRRQLPPSARAKLAAGGSAMELQRRIGSRRGPLGPLRRALALLGPWSHVDRSPAELFGSAWGGTTQLDVLFFLQPTLGSRTRVTPEDAARVAERMTFAHQHHRRALLAAYQEYRYAFPERTSPLVEGLEDREREMLHRTFAGRPAYVVEHPPGGSIDDLFTALRPYCSR